MTDLSNKTTSQVQPSKRKLFVVMGVSGSGKTAVGQKLAKELAKQTACQFLDADDFHSPEAKQRMAANLPLDDAMRKPWVAAIMNKLVELDKQQINVVLAFSGLKHQHRKCFRTLDFQCYFYYLTADINIIRARMESRKNHFFKPELLASQFNDMQAVQNDEQDIKKIDVSGTLEQVYQEVYTHAHQVFSKEQS